LCSLSAITDLTAKGRSRCTCSRFPGLVELHIGGVRDGLLSLSDLRHVSLYGVVARTHLFAYLASHARVEVYFGYFHVVWEALLVNEIGLRSPFSGEL